MPRATHSVHAEGLALAQLPDRVNADDDAVAVPAFTHKRVGNRFDDFLNCVRRDEGVNRVAQQGQDVGDVLLMGLEEALYGNIRGLEFRVNGG